MGNQVLEWFLFFPSDFILLSLILLFQIFGTPRDSHNSHILVYSMFSQSGLKCKTVIVKTDCYTFLSYICVFVFYIWIQLARWEGAVKFYDGWKYRDRRIERQRCWLSLLFTCLVVYFPSPLLLKFASPLSSSYIFSE